MKVLITVTRKTEYASIVEMEPEQFAKMQEAIEDDDSGPEAKQLNKMINTRDWQNDELIRVDGIEAWNE